MTIYKIMLTMWVVFWIFIDLFFVYLFSIFSAQIAANDSTTTLFSTITGIILTILVLSITENYKKNKIMVSAVFILGFLYFFGKNIINLILNINFLGSEVYKNPEISILQFAWFFPSIMFFVANTYFAIKYCWPNKPVV